MSFSPDQPRDANGQWAEAGGPTATSRVDRAAARVKARADRLAARDAHRQAVRGDLAKAADATTAHYQAALLGAEADKLATARAAHDERQAVARREYDAAEDENRKAHEAEQDDAKAEHDKEQAQARKEHDADQDAARREHEADAAYHASGEAERDHDAEQARLAARPEAEARAAHARADAVERKLNGVGLGPYTPHVAVPYSPPAVGPFVPEPFEAEPFQREPYEAGESFSPEPFDPADGRLDGDDRERLAGEAHDHAMTTVGGEARERLGRQRDVVVSRLANHGRVRVKATEAKPMADVKLDRSDECFVVLSRAIDRAETFDIGKLPKLKNGKPCHYYWAEALPVGPVPTIDGGSTDITPGRTAAMAATLNKALSRGWTVPLPVSHDVADARNLGFVKQARVNARGSLELLRQFIGDDAVDEAKNKSSSVYFKPRTKDRWGNEYDDLIEHDCITSIPVVGGLGEYEAAVALSRDVRVTQVLIPGDPGGSAEPNQEATMALSPEARAKIEQVPGLTLKPDATEQDAIDALIAAATPKADVVTLAKADHDKLKQEAADATAAVAGRIAAERERDEANRAVAASREQPKGLDPEVKLERGMRVGLMIDGLAAKHYNPEFIRQLKAKTAASDVMLSRESGATDCRIVEFVQMLSDFPPTPAEGPAKPGDAVALDRNTTRPGDKPADDGKPDPARMAQLRAMVNLPTAKSA